MSLRKDIKIFITDWNAKYPIDYWWRKKYGVPFGSEKHRQTNFIDMYIDFIEQDMMEKYVERIKEKEEKREDEELNTILPGIKSKQIVKMSKKDIDDEFDNLDLTKFNDKKEN